MHLRSRWAWRLWSSWAVAACCHAVEIEPLGSGPYPVASTNLEVTVPPDANLFDYLNGKGAGHKGRYLTQLLAHPDAVPMCVVNVPADRARFGSYAGQQVSVVLYVLYPTNADNSRPSYTFPYRETGDNVFPHMQRPGEPPLFAAGKEKWPLIVYSGGYNTHGLWHLEHLKVLASHGYIVVDVFHGDGRDSSFLANLALRPLAIKAALDFMLQHPEFGPMIDRDRIGASGASGGGHTVLSTLGGVNPGKAQPGSRDARVRAGFGLVPFVGRNFGFFVDGWVFGKDYSGLRPVQSPFMAVYGELDASVPAETVEGAVNALAGPVYAVRLDRETHDLTGPANSDVHTWELLFFDAWLRDNEASRQRLQEATSVRGGVSDRRTIQRHPQ